MFVVFRNRTPWTSGYDDYKFDLVAKIIESADELDCFRKAILPTCYGKKLDERIVEYPWFFSRLNDCQEIILDAGSVLNFRSILHSRKLVKKKIYVMTLAPEAYQEKDIPVSYIYDDLRQISVRDGYFDVICSLSTIEHIGFDNTFCYTSDLTKKEKNKYSYIKAVEEFRRVLKKGGYLYLSVPFGRYQDFDWLQVFDCEMLEALINAFCPSEITKTFFKYECSQWQISDESDCQDSIFNVHISDIAKGIHKKEVRNLYKNGYPAAAQSVVCLEMRK